MQGKLIVIEGLDSSGKETQSKLLLEYFLSRGVKAKRVEFPNYKSESSTLVKMYLRGDFGKKAGDVNPYAASSFYAVDRYATYKTEIKEFYENSGLIIADRYTTSNLIHQASKIDGDASEFIDWLLDFEYNLLGLPKPDKVIFLNMPTNVAVKLMKSRINKATGEAEKDIHESDILYLENTYKTAMSLSEKLGWSTVACSDGENPRTIEEIHKDVIGEIV